MDDKGTLTNAGALMADNCSIRWSGVFCTRWNGMDKGGGVVDAIDDAEYSGSLINLLNEGTAFIEVGINQFHEIKISMKSLNMYVTDATIIMIS